MASLAPPPKAQVLRTDDGVDLSYYTIGSGPGIVVINGAMSFALTQYELALALSSDYTVYLYSRRGRGLSGPYPSSITDIETPLRQGPSNPSESTDSSGANSIYDAQFSQKVLQTELDDLSAILRHTGATYIFGISSGALLALAACNRPPGEFPPIEKAVIFEPPLIPTTPPPPEDAVLDLSLLKCYEAELASGDVSSALVSGMRVAQAGPGWLRMCPNFVIRFLTNLIVSAEAKEQARKKAAGEDDEGAATMAQLAPMMRYDFAIVETMMDSAAKYSQTTLGHRVLLIEGADSPKFLKHAMRCLINSIREGGDPAKMECEEISGAGHELFENKRRQGKVELGIASVKKFLAT